MKTPLHVQLRNSLLFEAIGGGYRPGERFLSNRKICRKWEISDTTARKALRSLVEQQILRARPQSGYYLRKGFRKRALLLLQEKGMKAKLPSPQTLATKRFQYLVGSEKRQRRMALVWYDTESAAGIGRLPPKMSATGWDWSHGFFSEAIANGCEVYFFVLTFHSENQPSILSQIIDAKMDGVAVFVRHYEPQLPAMLQALGRANIPAIRIFGDSEGMEMPTVNLNNVAIGYTAAKYFLENGHRRMAVLIDSVKEDYFEERLEGFQAALDHSSEKTELRLLRMPNPALARLKRLFERKEHRPTALFATRIEQYALVEPIVKEAGLKIPNDLSVIACGGTEQLPEMARPVDSFIIDFKELGKIAFRRLHETVAGKLQEKTTLVEVPLRRCGSTGKIR